MDPPENSIALAFARSLQATLSVYFPAVDSVNLPSVVLVASSTSSPPKIVAPSAPSSTMAVTVSAPPSVMRVGVALALTVSVVVAPPLLVLLLPLLDAPLLVVPSLPPLVVPFPPLWGSVGAAPVSLVVGAVPDEHATRSTPHTRNEATLCMSTA